MLNVAFLACRALIKHSNEDTALGQRQHFEIVQGQVGFWQRERGFKTYSKAMLCTDTTLTSCKPALSDMTLSETCVAM